MTREEAIEILYQYSVRDMTYPKEDIGAFELAIKALEQEPILDKIRAEIEAHERKTLYIDPYDLVGDCLDIIDKYKAESEDD